MTVADTVCVPTAHLTWFGEEYITGSCQVCPVTDSEFSFSFCDEGDVIVGGYCTFPWVKNFGYTANQRHLSEVRFRT